MRQLFTEALLVSLVGGAIGVWGSVNLLQWLTAWQPFPQFPINIPVSPDNKVYFFALHGNNSGRSIRRLGGLGSLRNGGWKDQLVFTDKTADLLPSNAAADASILKISPGYFRAAGTNLLSGRDVEWTDDKTAPRVAVVKEEFARELFGSAKKALDGHYRLQDGTRIQVVGIVQNGKFNSLTENQEPAMFLPLLQSPSSQTWMVVRSNRDPHDLMSAIQSRLRGLDSGLPLYIETWDEAMVGVLFPSRVATVALGILGLMGAILSITGIFGMAAYAVSKRKRELGIRIALGAGYEEVLKAALGRTVQLLAFGSAVGLVLGMLASRVLAAVVFEASPRDPFVLTGVVLAMALVGLVAKWIPAQRALMIDPAMLLREE